MGISKSSTITFSQLSDPPPPVPDEPPAPPVVAPVPPVPWGFDWLLEEEHPPATAAASRRKTGFAPRPEDGFCMDVGPYRRRSERVNARELTVQARPRAKGRRATSDMRTGTDTTSESLAEGDRFDRLLRRRGRSNRFHFGVRCFAPVRKTAFNENQGVNHEADRRPHVRSHACRRPQQRH